MSRKNSASELALNAGQREALKLSIKEYASQGRKLQRASASKKVPVDKAGKFLKQWSTLPGTDPDELCDWVDQGGEAISWVLGPEDLIIDVDVHADKGSGMKAMNRLRDEGLLPETFSVATGGGGIHLYYSVPDGLETGAKKKKLEGYDSIDFLGKGQQVLIRGSLHPSGNPYRATPASPSDVTTAPDLLIEMVRRSSYNHDTGDDVLNLLGRDDYVTAMKIFRSTVPPEDRATWVSLIAAGQYVGVKTGRWAPMRDAILKWCERGANYDPAVDPGQVNSFFTYDRRQAIESGTAPEYMRLGTLVDWAKTAERWTDEDQVTGLFSIPVYSRPDWLIKHVLVRDSLTCWCTPASPGVSGASSRPTTSGSSATRMSRSTSRTMG
jgi:hypothetical protein